VPENSRSGRREVVVVTGGGAGIGAAIAEAFGRTGAHVVTVDPGVTVDGLGQEAAPKETTADRIVAAGGSARASNTSVTDAAAVDALFAELVDELGGLDAVVNVAGISRPSGFAEGDEAAWTSVVSVHLDGYLNVLRAALPIMAAAGHGRILGVTSGSGWRPANAGAYSCAKRAVAALTWQVGRVAPPGVTVNALSPIAATRMVTSGLRAQAPAAGANRPAAGNQAADTQAADTQTANTQTANTQTGGLSLALAAMPSPDRLGPVGAYLGGPTFSWSTGNIVFSNGSEIAPIIPPELLELVRTTDTPALAHVFDTVVPAAFVPAESAQQTNGASNGRFEAVFDDVVSESAVAGGGARSCLLVTDVPEWESALRSALTSRGVECTVIDGAPPARDFTGAAAQLARAADAGAAIDAVVVARRGVPASSARDQWQRVLDEHTGVTEEILSDVAWVRAVSDRARETGRAMRIATVVDATTAGGRSRAQAAAQLSRAAHLVTDIEADAFAIGVETDAGGREPAVAELVAHLVGAADASALSGAELVATRDWIGLRGHPRPGASVSFGGPELPDWVDGALRTLLDRAPEGSRA
jgi:NAD(P)-dependent dehydrogenase (short-subunit alcohol dehydrogenase family)